jgi:hypothetical protein
MRPGSDDRVGQEERLRSGQEKGKEKAQATVVVELPASMLLVLAMLLVWVRVSSGNYPVRTRVASGCSVSVCARAAWPAA